LFYFPRRVFNANYGASTLDIGIRNSPVRDRTGDIFVAHDDFVDVEGSSGGNEIEQASTYQAQNKPS
jgi:hypothetical protein